MDLPDFETAVQLGFALDGDAGSDRAAALPRSFPLLHDSPDYLKWDGGICGGAPSWLNPEHLPDAAVALRCDACPSDDPTEEKGRMRFVAQIYCPLGEEFEDDGSESDVSEDEGPRASPVFHRSLYVFCCPDCDDPSRSVRVLRAQLPRRNAYYPYELPEDDDDAGRRTLETEWTAHRPASYGAVCELTRFPSGCECPVSGRSFRDAVAAEEYRACVHEKRPAGDDEDLMFRALRSVYARREIAVEEEPEEKADPAAAAKTPLFRHEAGDEEDAALDQSDLDRLTDPAARRVRPDGADDPAALAFWARTGRNGGAVQSQVLRYDRWPTPVEEEEEEEEAPAAGPLWIRSAPVPRTVPPCDRCGAPRAFEFQIMPQMLHALGVGRLRASDDADAKRKGALAELAGAADRVRRDAARSEGEGKEEAERLAEATAAMARNAVMEDDGDAMDWGTLAVYTCTESCDGEAKARRGVGLGAYVEEFAWRQPPL